MSVRQRARSISASAAGRWGGVAPWVAVAAYVLVALVYLVRGRINFDEGWYLYAGRLAYRGEVPYRDFAYTQTPLLPYVYGLPQTVLSSLWVGRVTSLVLATAGLGMLVVLVRRLARPLTAVLTALLVAAVPPVVYFLTITKTYALSFALFAATLLALTSDRPQRVRYPLAVAAASAMTLTRSPGAGLAATVFVFCLVTAEDAVVRRNVAVTAAGFAAALVAFILVAPESALWNLVGYHQQLWEGVGYSTRLSDVLGRLPEWFSWYSVAAIVILLALVLAAVSRPTRAYCRSQGAIVVGAIGVVTFLAVQLAASQFNPVEYAVPVYPVAVALALVVIDRFLVDGEIVLPATVRRWGVIVPAVAMGVAGVLRLTPSDFVDPAGSELGLTAADRLGDYVADHTAPGDEVLALWRQDVNITADSPGPPDVSVGIFSYTDLSTDRAESVHFLNLPMLLSLLEQRRPAVVVLDEVDWAVLERNGFFSAEPGDPGAVAALLEEGYELTYEQEGRSGTGDGRVRVEVWLRR
ncbi:MAG: hypothetical protein JJLCMIEE_01914 [Acidimicrobiales bacterium]|nr:MAG: hypothetical protein EDR02_10415 [Actinomycetota bacterium]MBV6508848.1 hypothetical protein [Acidimicrobiales bacterium]RIK04974.1 MAG: hypothetical protein DCC48_11525 [Acidobacteriota bacterium]